MADTLLFKEKCHAYLEERWRNIEELFKNGNSEPLSVKDAAFKTKLKNILVSKTKSYRYVLPTQLLCKSVDPSLDCRSLQASYKAPGAFDARTIAHQVIVPFDKLYNNVFGGSNEPYVNNPLRYPAVTSEYRSQQKNKNDWDVLVELLTEVESRGNEFAKLAFDQVLFEIRCLLEDTQVTYPVPSRVSLDDIVQLIDDYISERSGGERLESIVASLFQTIAETFNIFDKIKRTKVNASDASSGMISDIECYWNDELVLLVEVKDQSLNLVQLDSKIDIVRSKHIREIIFIAQKGVNQDVQEIFGKRVSQEFKSGQNIYITNFIDFAYGIFILLGEKGRALFLGKVGSELDRVNAALSHRKKWAELLKSI